MRTFDLAIDDIDEFVCGNSSDDWHADYVQLSPGKLKFRTRVVELPGITIYWNHFETRMRIKEAYVGKKLVFGFLLQAKAPFLFRGREFSLNRGIIQHGGTEHYYMVPENIDSLILHVDRALIEGAGLHICNTVEMPVPQHAMRALTTVCRSVTHLIQVLPVEDISEQLETQLRNRVLLRLIDALQPWSTSVPAAAFGENPLSRDYLLFRKAEHSMSISGPGARLSIDRLADDLGVSKRRLFYAFKKWAGMGPGAYHEILRLHFARDYLLASNSVTTRVTDAASELGFNHLGRFAGHYYELFGEYPSRTLRRERK